MKKIFPIVMFGR